MIGRSSHLFMIAFCSPSLAPVINLTRACFCPSPFTRSNEPGKSASEIQTADQLFLTYEMTRTNPLLSFDPRFTLKWRYFRDVAQLACKTINLPTKERISRKAKHTRESRESNIFMRQSCAFSPELMKVARANPSAEHYLKIPRLKQRIRPVRTRGIRENLTPRKSYPCQQFLSVLRLHVRMIYARLYNTWKITRELLIKTNRINIPLNQLIVAYLHETLCIQDVHIWYVRLLQTSICYRDCTLPRTESPLFII